MICWTNFKVWKEKLEKDHQSSFVKSNGPKRTKTSIIHSYSCNRSGFHFSKGSGKRQIRSQGSSKIGCHCTAQLSATVDNSTGEVVVKSWLTHYGHSCDLAHLHLANNDRQKVASRVKDGVTFDRIIDDIRSNISSRVDRVHLITKKDVSNIQQSFGLQGVERHPDDATSLAAMIKDLNSDTEEGRSVLFSKFQSDEAFNLDSNLDSKDFMIVIQTPLQAHMFQAFGHNRVVCMDATHGTNAYRFHIITLLVVDDFGEGMPVAWCISNRGD